MKCDTRETSKTEPIRDIPKDIIRKSFKAQEFTESLPENQSQHSQMNPKSKVRIKHIGYPKSAAAVSTKRSREFPAADALGNQEFVFDTMGDSDGGILIDLPPMLPKAKKLLFSKPKSGVGPQ